MGPGELALVQKDENPHSRNQAPADDEVPKREESEKAAEEKAEDERKEKERKEKEAAGEFSY